MELPRNARTSAYPGAAGLVLPFGFLMLAVGCTSLSMPAWRQAAPDLSFDAVTADQRIAALDQSAQPNTPLPGEALALLDDPDPRVRIAALSAVGVSRDVRAEESVIRRLDDPSFSVRTAAVEALALLDTASSWRRLEEICNDSPPKLKMTVIDIVARHGQGAKVLKHADDESWQVRRAVARSLTHVPPDVGLDIAIKLVSDKNAGVQKDAVEAVETWPWPASGKVWLAAMESEVYLVRKSAGRRLIANWPAAADFPLQAYLTKNSPSHAAARAELARLRELWNREYSEVDGRTLAKLVNGLPQSDAPPPAELIEKVKILLSRLTLDDQSEESAALLAQLDESLPGVLEHIAIDEREPIPEAVFSDVLPRINPVFAALIRMRHPDVQDRRLAADELLRLTRQEPLGNLAAERMTWLVTRQSDTHVWLRGIESVGDPTRPCAIRLGVSATGHPDPRVRSAGCRLLGMSKSEAASEHLTKLAADPDEGVAVAALDALSASGAEVEPTEFVPLLQKKSIAIELAAGELLAKQGLREGIASLRRLSYETSRPIRGEAARRMANSRRREFTDDMVRFLDDSPELRKLALETLPVISGHAVDVDARASEGAQCEAWKKWRMDGHDRAASRESS